MKTRLLTRVKDFIVFSLLASAAHLAAAPQLVSTPGPALPSDPGGNGDSGLSIMTPDGRYVLFASMASNLTSNNNFNLSEPFRCNVFLRDNLSQTVRLVSVNNHGVGGNGDSFPTGVSTNGRFALFESSGSDLVANATNNLSNIFVRDMLNGITTLVSVTTNGGSSLGSSRGSTLTPDGRYAAFVCTADDLVAGDTNGIADVFVRDLQAGTTTLVSVGAMAAGSSFDPGSSESPEITPDGRYVAFYSTATNLVAGVMTTSEVYVRDLMTEETSWASTNARVIAQAAMGSSNVACCNYSISDDGEFVAFEACSNAPGSSGVPGLILRFNLQTGWTDLICSNASVPRLAYELMHDLSLSPNGRFVGYVAGRSIGTNAIYRWDAPTGSNTLVSVSRDEITPATGICDSPLVSPDGRFVAFTSSAANLVTNPTVGDYHLYVRDTQAGVTRLLDLDTNDVGTGVDSVATPAMSADGSVTAFECTGILPKARHLTSDVFMQTAGTGANELVSARSPASQLQTPNGGSGITPFCTSSNGQFVVFYSEADNLVPNDANGCRDVFVRDLIGGTNILVSVNTNGNSGDGLSTDPCLSGNGRYVVFVSWADDLVNNDTNQAEDVFVRDLQTGTTVLVSVSTNGISPGNADSFSPMISADGRYVLFYSIATNLAADLYYSGYENLFFRDLQTGTTYKLTSEWEDSPRITAAMTPDGRNVAFTGTFERVGSGLLIWNPQRGPQVVNTIGGVSQIIAISPDGQKIAYSQEGPSRLYAVDLVSNTTVSLNVSFIISPTHENLQFSRDGRFLTYSAATMAVPGQNVYRYDFQLGTNQLISQNYNFSGAASANSDSPAISPDGRFIAYRSLATNLVPFDAENVAELYVYDASNHATMLVSVNTAGGPAADRSLTPVFSGDSRWLFFESWAPDLCNQDFNRESDIFVVDLTTLPFTGTDGPGATNVAAFAVQFFPTGIYNSNPTLAWPLAAGKAYQVQYTTNLTDAVWQNLNADINISGGTGYVCDPAPMATGQRFYRIVSRP